MERTAGEPMLALPGPEHGAVDFARGGFEVCGKPVLVAPEGGQGRGTAWDVWDGAYRLAQWLERASEKDAFKFALPSLASDAPRNDDSPPMVIELGSGTGLGGLAARASFPETDVTLTDLPEAMDALKENIKLNAHLIKAHGLPRLRALPLDWTTTLTGSLPLHIAPAGYDLVLAADCVWLMELIPAFVRTLRAVTHARSLVLLAYQERSRSASRALFGTLDAYFTLEDAEGFLLRLEDEEHGRPPRGDEHVEHGASAVRLYILRRRVTSVEHPLPKLRRPSLVSVDRALIEEGAAW